MIRVYKLQGIGKHCTHARREFNARLLFFSFLLHNGTSLGDRAVIVPTEKLHALKFVYCARQLIINPVSTRVYSTEVKKKN